MNVPKTSAIIEAEMKIRDYKDNPVEEVYFGSMGSLDTLNRIGLFTEAEVSRYKERLTTIRTAQMNAPTMGDD